MKKKKKKQKLSQPMPEAVTHRSGKASQDGSFSLEEIMREFGVSDGSQSPPESTPAQKPESTLPDPALRSPIPRHRTTDPDPETQRYNGADEALPERQIPRRPEEAAAAPEAAPPSDLPKENPPLQSKPDGTSVPPKGSRLWPEFSNLDEMAGVLSPPRSRPRSDDSRWRKPGKSFAPSEAEASSAPVRPRWETRSPESSAIPETRRKSVWVNSASRKHPEPEPSAAPEPPKSRRQPADLPGNRQQPAPPKAPVKPPRPLDTPETQYRRAGSRRRSRLVRLGFCLFFALAALALGFCRSQEYLDAFPYQKLLAAGEPALLLLCTALAYDVLTSGIRRLLQPGFSLLTLITLEVVICLADGFLALPGGRVTYCPLVCLLLCAALWSLSSADGATCAVMDPARKGAGNLALTREPNVFQKLSGVLYGPGSLQEFLQANHRPAGPERVLDAYALAVFLLSAGVAGLTCRGNTAHFLQYWSATLLAGTPLAGAIVWSRPWCILSRRLQRLGAALYGWTGICRLDGKLVVPISDEDLFPAENVKMNGVKYFGGQSPDHVVAYGAAVISAAGSGLSNIFEEQLEIRGARRYSVSKLRRYEVGGVGAEIGSDSVLVGSLRFMQSMGVDMPAGTRVSQAVYVAINGSLAGVFAVHYGVSRSVLEGLSALTVSRGVSPVVTAGDFIITESFLRSKFRINTAKLKMPPFPARSELSQKQASEAARPCALLQEKKFGTLALAVTGARALRTATRWGLLFDIVGGIMGMAIMAVLADLSAGGVMSLVNLTLFLLLWSVPSLLLSGWPRNV